MDNSTTITESPIYRKSQELRNKYREAKDDKYSDIGLTTSALVLLHQFKHRIQGELYPSDAKVTAGMEETPQLYYDYLESSNNFSFKDLCRHQEEHAERIYRILEIWLPYADIHLYGLELVGETIERECDDVDGVLSTFRQTMREDLGNDRRRIFERFGYIPGEPETYESDYEFNDLFTVPEEDEDTETEPESEEEKREDLDETTD